VEICSALNVAGYTQPLKVRNAGRSPKKWGKKKTMQDRTPSAKIGRKNARRKARESAARFRHALKLHQAGRLQEAIKAYRQILAVDPGSVQARTYCGAALLDRQRTNEAAQILQQAVLMDPKNVDALCYLGNAQQETGRLKAAEKSYRRALAIRPDFARAHNNLGVLLKKLGRKDDAAASFRRAVGIEPRYAQAYNNLSEVLLELDEADKAIAAARRAIEIEPRYAEAFNSHGSALRKADRIDEAIAAYQRALSLRPGFLYALNNLAVALIIADRPGEALEACERSLEIDPGSVGALASKSVALSELGNREALEVLVDFDRHIHTRLVDPGEGFADLAEFNNALAQHVCSHPTLVYEKSHTATREGRHSGDLLREPKGPIGALEILINGAVEDYLRALPEVPGHPIAATAPKNWQLNVWSVVLEGAGHQIPHIHESGWLSGVYYAKVPDAVSASPDKAAGWIEFGRPLALYCAKPSPAVRLIQPREGLMVLFPSYFFHSTIPTGCLDTRVSIAFDVIDRDRIPIVGR
jgi:tetratricopeptide (TPR) repeat protein